MENKLAEAINTVRSALQEIERREKAAANYVAEQNAIALKLSQEIDGLKAEHEALVKSVATARKETQQKLQALKAAAEGVLRGI